MMIKNGKCPHNCLEIDKIDEKKEKQVYEEKKEQETYAGVSHIKSQNEEISWFTFFKLS